LENTGDCPLSCSSTCKNRQRDEMGLPGWEDPFMEAGDREREKGDGRG
jgi:hypothetical protein